jgi:uncharacterized protein YndB with AHSA1/START domain
MVALVERRSHQNKEMRSMTERVVVKTLELDAPIERVWKAITDPAELSRWFGDRTVLELRPGSDGAMIWEEHGSFAVRVEEVEAPRRLVWSWVHEAGVAFEDAPATRVEWVLERRDDGGTTLRLRETGFRTDLHHQQNTHGWDEELAELVGLVGVPR